MRGIQLSLRLVFWGGIQRMLALTALGILVLVLYVAD